jgi:hypothetical protein
MKKGWKKPVISMFVRGFAEETVLWACKDATGSATDPSGPAINTCGQIYENGVAVSYCNENMLS